MPAADSKVFDEEQRNTLAKLHERLLPIMRVWELRDKLPNTSEVRALINQISNIARDAMRDKSDNMPVETLGMACNALLAAAGFKL